MPTPFIRVMLVAVTLFIVCACHPSAQAQNLILNGDFSLGTAGITTDYGWIAGDVDPRNFGNGKITVASSFYYYDGKRSVNARGGAGRMMLVDGATTDGRRVWAQTVAVLPGKDYKFTAFATKMTDPNVARLQVKINGVVVGLNSVHVNLPPGQWHEIVGNWNSGTATTAEISITDLTKDANGNDFAIDDISFICTSPGDRTLPPFMVSKGYADWEDKLRYIRQARWYNTAPMSNTWSGNAVYGTEWLNVPIANFVGKVNSQSLHPSGREPINPMDRLNRAYDNHLSQYTPRSTYFITHDVTPGSNNSLHDNLTTSTIKKVIQLRTFPVPPPPPFDKVYLNGSKYSTPGIILDKTSPHFGAFQTSPEVGVNYGEGTYTAQGDYGFRNQIPGGWELPHYNDITDVFGTSLPYFFLLGNGLEYLNELRDYGQFGDYFLRLDIPINFTETLLGYRKVSASQYVEDGTLEYYPKRVFIVMNGNIYAGNSDVGQLRNKWSLSSVEFQARRLNGGQMPVTNSLVPHYASLVYWDTIGNEFIGKTDHAMLMLSRGSSSRGATNEDYLGALALGFDKKNSETGEYIFKGGLLAPPVPGGPSPYPGPWSNASSAAQGATIRVVYEMEWIGKRGISSPRNTSAYRPADMTPYEAYDVKFNKADSSVWNVIE